MKSNVKVHTFSDLPTGELVTAPNFPTGVLGILEACHEPSCIGQLCFRAMAGEIFMPFHTEGGYYLSFRDNMRIRLFAPSEGVTILTTEE